MIVMFAEMTVLIPGGLPFKGLFLGKSKLNPSVKAEFYKFLVIIISLAL